MFHSLHHPRTRAGGCARETGTRDRGHSASLRQPHAPGGAGHCGGMRSCDRRACRGRTRTLNAEKPVAPAKLLEAPDDLEAINTLYRERRWSDGLPIVPPTQERVENMVRAAGRARSETV